MVVRTLKKVPSIAEYELVSSHTQGPLTRRFGSWLNVPQGMKEFAEKEGWAVDWKDVLEIVGEANGAKDGTARSIRASVRVLNGAKGTVKGAGLRILNAFARDGVRSGERGRSGVPVWDASRATGFYDAAHAVRFSRWRGDAPD
jgi:hypothetical protein